MSYAAFPSKEAFELLGSIVRQTPNVDAVYLFGSMARVDHRFSSDIDLGILFHEDLPSHQVHLLIGDLAARLEGVFGSHPVDVVDLSRQGPVFCHQVLIDGRLLFEGDHDRRIDFETRTIMEALDFRPTLELATQGYLKGYRSWLEEYRDKARRTTTA